MFYNYYNNIRTKIQQNIKSLIILLGKFKKN